MTQNQFDVVRMNKDYYSPVRKLMVKEGAIGYIVAEFNGFSVKFDTDLPENQGKLINSRYACSFGIDWVRLTDFDYIKRVGIE